MTMLNLRKKLEQFNVTLEQLDALGGDIDPDTADELDDLNAELEDLLLMLSEIKPTGDDWQEEVSGIMEDIQAMSEDYAALGAGIPDVLPLAAHLRITATAAIESLEDE